MKNFTIPYLRTLLLLTLFVGLLGVAKTILLNKVGSLKQPLPSVSDASKTIESHDSVAHQKTINKQTSSEKYALPTTYVWSTQGTQAKPSSWNIGNDETQFKIAHQDIDQSYYFLSELASDENNESIDINKDPNKDEANLAELKLSEFKIAEQFTESIENDLKYALERASIPRATTSIQTSPIVAISSFQDHLARQAELRLQSNVTYDGRYVKIGYPMGDVPKNIGVCTDVVIRSFRGLGIDLQQRVHEDMKRNFHRYPNNWRLSKPDTNIDHRRVPNLMTYFKRIGASLAVTQNPVDYKVGNIVTWDLGQGLTHIGIVSNSVSAITGNPLIVHNIGAGPELNDMLFKHRITGHFNYGTALSSSRMKSFAKNNDYLDYEGETGS
ncbi:DUF1287 domain-containing protein [uncultured Cocleimonas sp.]|uniref:DUF1287 domain-containing protein n=1 Tax=uncultured Cocleimonas sp. TaxID=1051587 RepID=UPI00263462B0|nr:DUF1287 domain-containing protein [uncultured Cocleimonas sp.]